MIFCLTKRFPIRVSADGNIHILLEYCSQKSLLHVMKNRKVLTEPEVRYYMVQICEGVRYLHRKTILHRDLKLGNMFLTWDMTVKIGDFGLATQHQASISSVSTLCGTPNYIAPEVLKKQVCSLMAILVMESWNAKLIIRRLLEIVFLFLQSVFFGVQNRPAKLILCTNV